MIPRIPASPGRVPLRLASISLLSLAVLAVGAARAQAPERPDLPLPAPAAPNAVPSLGAEDLVTPLDLDWTDAARNRPVPVRLYLPPSASAERPVPLVVFSHGIGGSRRGYSYLGRYWASRGYASLHLQHVGSDRSLWMGNVFTLVGRLQNAAREDEALARVADLRFALDRLLATPDLAARIDRDRVVAAGHSYGANTTLLAAGARVERDGRVIDVADPRIKAAIVISAPPFYGERDMARILSAIRVPTLHVTATEDTIRIPGYFSGVEDRVAVFEATPGPAKVLAVFEGGSHSIFTDRGGTGGPQLNPQVKEATRELSLAFLKRVFEKEDAPLAAWPRRFAGLISRFTAP
jgi:predicted dienelactone hydrolase